MTTESLTDRERKEIDRKLNYKGSCKLCKCGRFIDLDNRGKFINHPKNFFTKEACDNSGKFPNEGE